MDHPGGYTDFFLGFQTHDGVRHNLGFYELIYTVVVLIPAMWVWGKPDATPGRITALLALLYAPARFGLDFLRSTDQVRSDPRYFGLTFGHYSSLFFMAIGLWMLWRQREDAAAPASAPRRSGKSR
jgi:phosphatidylglycerol:prolipoprotein diacylglycerol transferase